MTKLNNVALKESNEMVKALLVKSLEPAEFVDDAKLNGLLEAKVADVKSAITELQEAGVFVNTVKGLAYTGNWQRFDEVTGFINDSNPEPVVESRTYTLEMAKDAMQRAYQEVLMPGMKVQETEMWLEDLLFDADLWDELVEMQESWRFDDLIKIMIDAGVFVQLSQTSDDEPTYLYTADFSKM